LASGGDDQIIRLWDTGSGIMKTQLPGHSGTISTILFGSNSKWLTSLSQDQTIKIWNLEAGKEKDPITLKAHRKPLAQDTYQNLSISKDGNFMASVAESDDGELLFWNLSEIRGASRDTLVKDSCGFIRGYLKNGASVDNRNICDVVSSVKGD
jgi:WD40 repeat protein